MVIQAQFVIRQANPYDLQQLANLIHFESHVHRHMDYRQPLDWIDKHPFLVLEHNGEINAALACPPDPPKVAWIRLFATSSRLSAQTAWETLWYCAFTELVENHHPLWAAAIPVHGWLNSQLKKSGFEETHQIVMLRWEGLKPSTKPKPIPATIRLMTPDDLENVQRIDEVSFVPIWQNSVPSLDFAFRQSVVATVAEQMGKPIGYQISTATNLGGHLARLAVCPDSQGNGIGYALVHDLLTRFTNRGTRILTVNTQKNNPASLALYKRAGFILTGEEYSILQNPLSKC